MSNLFNYLHNPQNQHKEILATHKSNQETLKELMLSLSPRAGHMMIILKLLKILIL